MRPVAATLVALGMLALLAVTPFMATNARDSALSPNEQGALAELTRTPLAPARFTASGQPSTFEFTRNAPLDADADALVIIAPSIGYSADEARTIHLFLERGGQVILTVSGAPSQELLNRLSVGLSTSGMRVYTPAFNETPDRMVALNVGEFPGLPQEVVIQRAVAIQGGQPILRTADLSWEDRNDNGRPDLDEPLRAATLAAYADVGEGRIYVIGDALLFRTQPDVANAFFDAAASGGRRIVFDEAHRPFSDPFTTNRILTGSTAPLFGVALTLTILVMVAAVTLAPRLEAAQANPRLSRSALSDDRLADALAELKP